MMRLSRLFGHIEEPSAVTVGRKVDHIVDLFLKVYAMAG
jgi:hypothetical protein